MNIEKFKTAQKTLVNVINHTPIVHASKIHDNLFIKAENLQATGSFKIRGAYYKCKMLSVMEKQRGVIAASAGNHAQGVAFACMKMGIKATIVMPTNAPLSKVTATKQYGGNVILYGADFDEAYAHAKELQAELNAVFIEPFNDEDIIAGQGSIGFEILDDLPQVDCVIVPIGGGGLISGIACVLKQLKPSIKIIGVEIEHGNSMQQSLSQNACIQIPKFASIADGIAVKKPGELTLALVKKYVDEIVVVDEEEIAAAILVLLEKMKIVSEGAGACAVAAAMFNKVDISKMTCLSVVSGGNIDVNLLAKIMDLGLMKTGRKAVLQMSMGDTPGELAKCMKCLASSNANIISVTHNRIQDTSLFQQCLVEIVIETCDHAHIQHVLTMLQENSFDVAIINHV